MKRQEAVQNKKKKPRGGQQEYVAPAPCHTLIHSKVNIVVKINRKVNRADKYRQHRPIRNIQEDNPDKKPVDKRVFEKFARKKTDEFLFALNLRKHRD